MTMRINATQGTGFEARVNSAEMSEATPDINFNHYGPDEDYFQAKSTKDQVKNYLTKNKNKFELVEPFLFGSDHFKVKGDGKMTYGELRKMLGIPPKVLSETNGKKLKDTDVVENIKINLSDIGWYEMATQTKDEAAVYRAERRSGNPYAGYDRSVSNEDILKWFKNK